ncbi:MAG: hypothetical protein KY476_08940, partial [Planctomycetes bacterium]|nr:hypothetical protein [Planctomycetota bacterium]
MLLTSALVGVCALCVVATSRAQEPGDVPLNLLGVPTGEEAAPVNPAIKATLTPASVKPGDVATLHVVIDIPAGYYVYSTDPAFGGRTEIEVSKIVGLKPAEAGFQPDKLPQVVFEPELKQQVEKHTGRVTWSRRYRVEESFAGPAVQVGGKITFQMCGNGTCRLFPNSGFPTDFTASTSVVQAAPEVTARTFVQQGRAKLATGQPGHVDLRIALSPTDAKPGEIVTLSIEATVAEGFHTYSMFEGDILGAKATSVFDLASTGLKPLAAMLDLAPRNLP